MKISTWLPLFSGFYESIWSHPDDVYNEMYHINQERADLFLPPLKDDDCIVYNYRKREQDISKKLCSQFESAMSDYVSKVTYENLYSPQAYNFETDRINCTITIKKRAIKKYLTEHWSAWESYIKKHFTSCSGFISFISNDITEWIDRTKNYTTYDACEMWAALSFIAKEEGVKEFRFYEDMMGNGFDVASYIENYTDLLSKPSCCQCGKMFDDTEEMQRTRKLWSEQSSKPLDMLCPKCQGVTEEVKI